MLKREAGTEKADHPRLSNPATLAFATAMATAVATAAGMLVAFSTILARRDHDATLVYPTNITLKLEVRPILFVEPVPPEPLRLDPRPAPLTFRETESPGPYLECLACCRGPSVGFAP